jgi:hypothetical protein
MVDYSFVKKSVKFIIGWSVTLAIIGCIIAFVVFGVIGLLESPEECPCKCPIGYYPEQTDDGWQCVFEGWGGYGIKVVPCK